MRCGVVDRVRRVLSDLHNQQQSSPDESVNDHLDRALYKLYENEARTLVNDVLLDLSDNSLRGRREMLSYRLSPLPNGE